ncbi:radical SAM family heme chaperone HemW [Agrococcus sp. Marseille-Q4369]|uniref:radical SAM family heme chaperone HemW n=1 Tax=Agrococcus sp. Marseille-Q4369 TaxID=2810513 RepID=UPI001B8ADA6F|nr:radical SAM family heme chaperone HemW [Agrococcus sp. Marseille-Q4369]QUW19065.1 coproporphyrinogen III oxidase [Agrococcus sp. Marseille-Q4369]
MGRLPDGEAAPADGRLPEGTAADAPFGAYIHVPFCSVRCGYCDFNTYTADELRGASRAGYPGDVAAEIRLAREVLGELGPLRPMQTVFFGGGTPTLLPSGDLVSMLAGVTDAFGLAEGAEVSVEANPDSIDLAGLVQLRAGGVTRVSIGMQSAVPHVLAALDRTHDPERVPLVVEWAREAGLEVSLDLIYGAPGESLDDWQRSLDAVVAMAPDHVSAYALIVEEGTALARRIRRGELAAPDDDLQAAMYEAADASLGQAGYSWYEISNWARGDKVARHNLAYWRGHDWWGFGPGAHSHVGGVRWWNVKHPAAYRDRLVAGSSPALAREVLDDETRRVERVLLESRIAEGLAIDVLDAEGRRAVAGLVADGLVDGRAALAGRVIPTLRGRLLADAVVRRLLP